MDSNYMLGKLKEIQEKQLKVLEEILAELKKKK